MTSATQKGGATLKQEGRRLAGVTGNGSSRAGRGQQLQDMQIRSKQSAPFYPWVCLHQLCSNIVIADLPVKDDGSVTVWLRDHMRLGDGGNPRKLTVAVMIGVKVDIVYVDTT